MDIDRALVELIYTFSGVGILIITVVFGADRERKARHRKMLAQHDLKQAKELIERDERKRLQRSLDRLGRL